MNINPDDIASFLKLLEGEGLSIPEAMSMVKTYKREPSTADRLEIIKNNPKFILAHDGVIYFTVVFDGKNCIAWASRFITTARKLSENVMQVLKSNGFEPSSKYSTVKVAVFPPGFFDDRTVKNVAKEAAKRGCSDKISDSLYLELACIILDMCNDKEILAMGLRWLTEMRGLIMIRSGRPNFVGRFEDADTDGSKGYGSKKSLKYNAYDGQLFICN